MKRSGKEMSNKRRTHVLMSHDIEKAFLFSEMSACQFVSVFSHSIDLIRIIETQ